MGVHNLLPQLMYEGE